MDKNSPRYADDFPKSFPLGGKAVGWYQSEIDAWLVSCATKAKSETLSNRSKSQPQSKVHAAKAPRALGQLLESAESESKFSPQHAAAPKQKPTKTHAASNRGSRPGNLNAMLIQGGNTNDRILDYLELKSWTPVMGALLISGIDPPPECNEIPDGGIGLDEKPLHASDPRFHEARHILKEWHDCADLEDDHVVDIDPVDYINWCIDQDIQTEWLALFLDLMGCSDGKRVDLTAARFALLTNR
jgi:hypothetical protein